MKPASTKRVQFVEMERLVGRELRDQEPVTGARFEDDILRLHVGQQSEDARDINRGRELLPFDLIFAADGLGRQALGEGDQGTDIRHSGEN